jgi:hypothetical protein
MLRAAYAFEQSTDYHRRRACAIGDGARRVVERG